MRGQARERRAAARQNDVRYILIVSLSVAELLIYQEFVWYAIEDKLHYTNQEQT